MYRRYKKYKRYKPRYRYYYHHDQTSIFEEFIEAIFIIIIKLSLLTGKLIFKLFKSIKLTVQKQPKKFEVEINKTHRTLETKVQSQTEPHAELNIDQKYSLKSNFLTPAEKDFLSILKQIVGDNYHIEYQVQLSRFVNVNDSNTHFTNYHDFNKIKAKSIDFLLLNKENKPHLAIGLDDSSHSRWDRIKRDLFVNDVMEQIGLPILRVRVAYPHTYNLEELKNKIFQFSDFDRSRSV